MDEILNFNELAFMHSAPRFGYSHNIAQLASSDIHRRWDYANGIIAFCMFFLTFFIVWALNELIFKCVLGVKRVGCLAGQVTYQPNDIHMCENQIQKRHKKIQFGFIFFCMVVFSGGIVFLNNGLPTLDTAVRETIVLNQDVQESLGLGLTVATSVEVLRSRLLNSPAHEMLLSDNYCVNTNDNVASLLLLNNNDNNTNTNTDTNIEIDDNDNENENNTNDNNNNNYTEKSIMIFKEFQDKLREEQVDGVKSGISHLSQNLYHFDNILVAYSDYHWIARMIILVMFNFCTFLMVSTIVNMMRKEKGVFQPLSFMTSYFILPLFLILIFVAWIMTAVVAVGAIMNSDLCVGSGEGPESTIENAFLENGFNVGDLTYQSFLYYKSDCTDPKPWEDFTSEYREKIEEGVNVSKFILSRIDDLGSAALMSTCGRDFMPIINEIDEVQRNLMSLSNNMDQGLELSRCERVSPIYTRFFDGPTCQESLAGLSWAFYGLFAVCIGGVAMFTLRSALYDIIVVHVDDDINSSLDDSMDEANERRQIQGKIGKTFTMDSCDTDDQGSEDLCDTIEKGIVTDNNVLHHPHGEWEPLTPTQRMNMKSKEGFDSSLDCISLSSSLSSSFHSNNNSPEIPSCDKKRWQK